MRSHHFRRFLLSSLLVFVPLVLRAQPTIEWQKALGGGGTEEARSLFQTSDGGFVTAGNATSRDGDVTGTHGLNDGWIVRLDKNGKLLWQRAVGGSGDDMLYSVIQTTDGGYLAVGSTTSTDGDITQSHGATDGMVVKLDGSGAIQWVKTYGGSSVESFKSVVEDAGGFVVVGQTISNDGDVTGHRNLDDIWVVRLDQSGSIQWEQTYGGTSNDIASAVIRCPTGGYVVAGSSDSQDGEITSPHGSYDFWVLKITTAGGLVWQRSFGGSGYDESHSIVATADGGYAISGVTLSNDGEVSGFHGGDDFWVVKIAGDGTFLWQKTLGGSLDEHGNAIIEAFDSGLMIAGYTYSPDGDVSGLHGFNSDVWLVKLSSAGQFLWQLPLGGSDDEVGYSLIPTFDGGSALAGLTRSNDGDVSGLHAGSDFWVVKFKVPRCNDVRITLPGQTETVASGDTLNIPVLALDSSAREVSVFDFALRLNTDFLTPIRVDTKAGQFAGSTVERFDVYHDSIAVRLRLKQPQFVAPGVLCGIVCKVFVTDTLVTSASILRTHLEDSTANSKCLTALGISAPDSLYNFTLTPKCGERTMSRLMAKQDILQIESIAPNPATSWVDVQLHIPGGYANDGVLQVFDELGNVIEKTPILVQNRISSVLVRLRLGDSSGVRYLRLKSAMGLSTWRVVVRR